MHEQDITFKPSWWARAFRQVLFKYECAVLQLTALNIQTKGEPKVIALDKGTSITKSQGWLWGRVYITPAMGEELVLGGLRRRDAVQLYDKFTQRRATFLSALALLKNRTAQLESLHSWIEARRNGEYWVSHYDIETVTGTHGDAIRLLELPVDYYKDQPAIVKAVDTIREFFAAPQQFRIKANERFVPLELERFKDYFETIESDPLTDSQQRAAVTHEVNTRVIAGAGSGKTSVIVAKAGYLIKKSIYNTNEVLLLAFNRSAADEMGERIKRRARVKVRATTFHALGLSIIGQVENRKPSLAKTATDQVVYKAKLRELLTALIVDPKTTAVVSRYFQSFFAPYKSQFDFNTLGEYFEYIRTHEIRTLAGELVMSFEEAEIANFLCLNGISYEYERRYEIGTATATYRQYKPDFYLLDYGIYIEHFGIQRNGKTAPYVNQAEYHEGMRWKRQLHRENDTVLIETYSYLKSEGLLLSELQRKLLEKGVKFQPVVPEVVLEKLNDSNRIDPLTQLIGTFLNQFKGSGHSIKTFTEQARNREQLDDRLFAFLSIFEPLLERYEAFLRESNVIDFNDMINSAVAYAKTGRYQSSYKCILVDEFQDISNNRACLVKALANQKPSHRLFCVGDDWQAIYRFAGSDIALLRDFEQHFGATETVALEHSFRFNDRIEAVATKFVLENPAQIKKSILTTRKEFLPRVIIHQPETLRDDVFFDVLREIYNQSEAKASKVMCIGRYNFLKEDVAWSKVESQFPSLQISFKTVHRSKGTEADYVIIMGMKSGTQGFPSEIEDDPILDIALSKSENFSHAEERRLFYVALTRARHAVHIIADHAFPSCFVSEIKTYDGLVETRGAAAIEPENCPSCVSGRLLKRVGQYGTFYSCANFPLCQHKVDACIDCRSGLLVLDKTTGVNTCNNFDCLHSERPCPSCGTGHLVERNGRYGKFLGCTNYSSAGCKHTMNIQ